MSKHWDYEDDHDWDYDYAGNGYVYWYGKYYPKEDIDALFKDSSAEDIQEGRGSNVGWALLVLVSIGAAGYGIYKKMIQGKDLPKKIVNQIIYAMEDSTQISKW